MTKQQQATTAIAIMMVALLIDQATKIWVKTHMTLGESYEIASWFHITFIENNGMAWGMTFINKMVLSLFRLVAIGFIGGYLVNRIRHGARTRYIVGLTLVLAGAVGNMLDSMFYGLFFSASSPFYVSYPVPFGEGYQSFLMGKVVDMLSFPLVDTMLPSWLPIWGGERFTFFDPIFNIADACVSVGVVYMLLFCRPELSALTTQPESKDTKPSVNA